MNSLVGKALVEDHVPFKDLNEIMRDLAAQYSGAEKSKLVVPGKYGDYKVPGNYRITIKPSN